MAQGPLDGVRVVEFAGIGPGPFCAMLLSDMGRGGGADRTGRAPGPAQATRSCCAAAEWSRST